MSVKLLTALILIGLAAGACSRDVVQRTTYETLQNIGEQQCEKDLSSQCPERESFDQYQRSRQQER